MRFLGLFLVLLMLFSVTAQASSCPEWVARAVSVQGTVELRVPKVLTNSAKRWVSVKRGDTFCENDVVRVKQNSRAALILTNDTVLRLDQNSTITFINLSANKASKLNLSKGVAHFISRVKQAFEVVTPFVNAAVEGTEFVVAANDHHSHVSVLEGKVRVSNPSGEILLTKNQVAVARKGQAPVRDIKIKPRDTVQWALYYPTIIDSSSSSLIINRAANKLALGRVNEALDDLSSIATTSTSYTDALALKAIVALVNNDKSEATALALQAYERDKQNISAILAMSYIQQAHFKIEAALEPLINYSKLNSHIYARMAEVYLMLGDLDNSLRHAEQAVKLDDKLSKSQAVLGYANLSKNNAKNAELNFKLAINLEQAAPLPHLGLGLSLIRQGQLEQGRREIEYAASLDPNNALIRSYLGKAYYEEKRDKVATDQFNMAKELDAKDPTAWFYSAIQKQSNNRPVEALQDLNVSTELNDNRAVYRSRLLLDEDQASRSSGLARIYSALGFEYLAQQQAFNSINQDFSNYSAHRFLAESYANRSRYEIGRVSELLQSQLLAPINIVPVAPHLSETQLGIQANAGPSGASFNQYDPLFARNQSRLQVSALAGNNKTYGDEVAYSQLFDNASLSLGQYHYETEGFRANNDYKQDILNGFLQTNLNSNHSLQFEVKKNEKENGDLRLRYEPASYVADYREVGKETSYRLGYNYKLNQSANILASVISLDKEFTRKYNEVLDPVDPTVLEVEQKEVSKAGVAELQFMQKQGPVNLVFGAGNYNNNRYDQGVDQITVASVVVGGGPYSNNIERESMNSYIYTQWHALHNLTLTLGMSHDDIIAPVFSTKQVNPKLGFLWDISPQTRFRLAGFRTLKRELIDNQTLEPTQVAGFNQFFDDPYATDAKNYGVALEHRFSNKVYGGIEATSRDLVVSIDGGGSVLYEGQKEYAHRAYIYLMPTNTLSLKAEFHYDDLEREINATTSLNEPARLTTRKVPLSVKVHYPGGLSASLTSTYYNHDVIQPLTVTSSRHDSSDFWITDANIAYKFSNRKGQVSLDIRNLLDESFNYYDVIFRTGLAQPATIYHERSVWLRMALTFD